MKKYKQTYFDVVCLYGKHKNMLFAYNLHSEHLSPLHKDKVRG